MFDPLLDKSPAAPAAGASANPTPPSVALAASPPPPPLLQPPVTPSPPPPMSSSTPPRSTTGPSRPTPQTAAPSTSPPPRPPPASASPPQQAGAAPYTSLSRLIGAAPRPRGHDIRAGGSGGGRSSVHTDGTGSGDDEPQPTLLGRLLWRRKRNPSLPVIHPASVPSSGGRATRIIAWFQTWHCDLMPDSEIHKRLAIFGSVLYGIMSLLPTTQKLIKGFPPDHQVAVLFVVGFVWTLSSIGAGCTIFGRTSLEHSVAKLATWVGMIGITLLVIFHIGLMLLQNYWRNEGKLNQLSATVFVILVCFAIAGYLIPLVLNKVCGEKKKMQDQQIRSSELIQTSTS